MSSSLEARIARLEAQRDIERLIADLGNLVTIRKETTEQRQRLLADRDSLTTDQRRLTALIAERQRQQADAEKDMDAERRRAADLSKQADNLRDLIAKMEQELKSAAKAAAAANLRGSPKAAGKKLPACSPVRKSPMKHGRRQRG